MRSSPIRGGGGGGGISYDVFPLTPSNFTATAAGTPPTLTVTNECQIWSFVQAATGEVSGSFFLPPAWRTISVGFFWVNPGADVTGNVRWRVALKKLDTGDLTSEAYVTDAAANVATGAQHALNLRANHITGFSVVPGIFGSSYSMLVSRIGGDAGDTIGNAVGLHSVSVQRTS